MPNASVVPPVLSLINSKNSGNPPASLKPSAEKAIPNISANSVACAVGLNIALKIPK